jgi:predicted ATP-grasp superfamily ATP-dependent carboligase
VAQYHPTMETPELKFARHVSLPGATLLLALTGWMDGGLVSTGTVTRLMENRPVVKVASIDPDPFYIFNYPGTMEVAAMFRPAVKYVDGLTDGPLDGPTNDFHADPGANLAFFIGREPNLRWQAFADCIFAAAGVMGVQRIIFIGSFGGTVPHTREPRMFGSVSHEHLRKTLKEDAVRLSDYEGPAGFSSLLLTQAPAHDIEMLSLVAEIPGYLQGINPLSIEAVTRRLAKLLGVPVDFDAMRAASNTWETKITEMVEKSAKLAATVRKLEEDYDNELIKRAEE